jgi:AraC-like DNA-binding protein
MSLIYKERLSDSPYIDLITEGWTTGRSFTIRPSEINWHMVFTKYQGVLQPLLVGPLTSSGVVNFVEDVEILWIKFKLGTFMPHLPLKNFLDVETLMPDAASKASFWLKSTSWQVPTYENADTFVDQLVRNDILMHDAVVKSALQTQIQLPDMASRTVRHRFLRATGLTQSHILQFERAQQAVALLEHGTPILDVVYQLGYYDQPHLTRSLKRFIGRTPAYYQPRICAPE